MGFVEVDIVVVMPVRSAPDVQQAAHGEKVSYFFRVPEGKVGRMVAPGCNRPRYTAMACFAPQCGAVIR